MLGIPDDVEGVAHVIQIALTPVFLLTGIASLLSVLSTRLARVADQVDGLAEKAEAADPTEQWKLNARLSRLRSRSLLLDLAVILATLGGISAAAAVLLLFIGSLREHAGISLFVAFGLAIVCTIGALAAFLVEMLLASRGIRAQAENAAEVSGPPETFYQGSPLSSESVDRDAIPDKP